MKKITMQDIADKLGISRVTVSKAMNRSDLVSEELREKIYRLAQELGYRQIGQDVLYPQKESESKKMVALAVSRPDSSVFWQNIIHSIAHSFSKENVSLMYTYLPSAYNERFRLPDELLDNTVSGLITINVYDEMIYQKLNELELPKVFLDTPGGFDLEKQNGDIVYIGGRIPIRKITMDLMQRGHKSIGFIGDIGYASSNRDRYDGFLDAMRRNHRVMDERQIFTSKIEVGTYEREIGGFLDSLLDRHCLPDAMVCVSDYVAHFVMEHLEKRGLRVPEDIAVTGFDRNNEYFSLGADFLTTAVVDSKAVGYKLVRQMLTRLQDNALPFEVSYLSTKVFIGQSSGER